MSRPPLRSVASQRIRRGLQNKGERTVKRVVQVAVDTFPPRVLPRDQPIAVECRRRRETYNGRK